MRKAVGYSGGFVIFRDDEIREYRFVPVTECYGDKILRYKTIFSFISHCPYTTDKIPEDKLRLAEKLIDELPVDEKLRGVLARDKDYFK